MENLHLCGFNLRHQRGGRARVQQGKRGMENRNRFSKEAVGRRAKQGWRRMVSETERWEEGTGVKRERRGTVSDGKAQVGWT